MPVLIDCFISIQLAAKMSLLWKNMILFVHRAGSVVVIKIIIAQAVAHSPTLAIVAL
jgi:hypothetical protein